MGVLRHVKKGEKKTTLIRFHQGTNAEITEHTELRIKGEAKDGGKGGYKIQKEGNRKNIGQIIRKRRRREKNVDEITPSQEDGREKRELVRARKGRGLDQ